MTDYYDGPRRGIADFDGQPHFYDSEWDDLDDDDAFTFMLTPVSPDVLLLALEDWAIWRRWETAFHEGRTAQLQVQPMKPSLRSGFRGLNLATLGRPS